MGVGEIPCGFMHFEQCFFVLRGRARVCQMIINSKHAPTEILANISAVLRYPMYHSLHDELRLSMRGKPADVDSLTGSFAIVRIYVTSLTGVDHSRLAHMLNHCCFH